MSGAPKDAITAATSADGRYRYSYTRTRDTSSTRAAVVLLNPVHSGDEWDPTTARCMKWLGESLGAGICEFVNLYALRAARPADLELSLHAGIDVIGPDNDSHIEQALAAADLAVAAWGCHGELIPGRPARVLGLVPAGLALWCFGFNSDGSPSHPNRRWRSDEIRVVELDQAYKHRQLC